MSSSLSNKLANMSLICACFVVLIHSGEEPTQGTLAWYISLLLFQGVTAIAVPYFFLVSGFFLGRHEIESHEYIPELKKRVRSLVVPFYLWNTSFWLLMLAITVAANILHGTALSRNLTFSGVWGLTGFGLETNLTPLWYVRTLFMLVCVSPLLVRLNKRPMWLVLPILGIVLYTLIRPELPMTHPVKHLCRFVFSPTGLLYFSLGLLFSRHDFKHQFRMGWYIVSLVVGFAILILRTMMPQVPGPTLAMRELAIPFLLFGIWGLMPDRPLPKVLTGLSFLIYVAHKFVMAILSLSLKTAGMNVTVDNWVHYVTFAMSSLALTFLSVIALKSLFPRTMRLLSGGR